MLVISGVAKHQYEEASTGSSVAFHYLMSKSPRHISLVRMYNKCQDGRTSGELLSSVVHSPGLLEGAQDSNHANSLIIMQR